MGDEESWTFIGDESDPELVRRLAEWDHSTHMSHGDTPTPYSVSSEAGEVGHVGKEG